MKINKFRFQVRACPPILFYNLGLFMFTQSFFTWCFMSDKTFEASKSVFLSVYFIYFYSLLGSIILVVHKLKKGSM